MAFIPVVHFGACRYVYLRWLDTGFQLKCSVFSSNFNWNCGRCRCFDCCRRRPPTHKTQLWSVFEVIDRICAFNKLLSDIAPIKPKHRHRHISQMSPNSINSLVLASISWYFDAIFWKYQCLGIGTQLIYYLNMKLHKWTMQWNDIQLNTHLINWNIGVLCGISLKTYYYCFVILKAYY